MELFDKSFSVIEKKLDLTLKRHSLLAGNAANSETPRYVARELDFAGELERALGSNQEPLVKTNARHMDVASSMAAHTIIDTSGAVGADGNNVDLDLTMGKISTNGSQYSKAMDLLGMKLRLLRTAIQRSGGA